MIVIARGHYINQVKANSQLCCLLNISELTQQVQQDSREKRTAKRLCVTNMTGLYSVFCCDLLLNLTVFWSQKLEICLKEGVVWRRCYIT